MGALFIQERHLYRLALGVAQEVQIGFHGELELCAGDFATFFWAVLAVLEFEADAFACELENVGLCSFLPDFCLASVNS